MLDCLFVKRFLFIEILSHLFKDILDIICLSFTTFSDLKRSAIKNTHEKITVAQGNLQDNREIEGAIWVDDLMRISQIVELNKMPNKVRKFSHHPYFLRRLSGSVR